MALTPERMNILLRDRATYQTEIARMKRPPMGLTFVTDAGSLQVGLLTPEMLAAVQVAVLNELEGRLAAVEAELESNGVDLTTSSS